jgi:hypothetical protein
MAEERSESVLVGATDEDDRARGMGVQVEIEVQRKRRACGGALRACCVTKSGSREPSVRALLQVWERCMLEALPDLRLPATVKAFDGILKARLTWRSKDGRNPEQQACAHDSTNGVGVLMRPLENHRVVELCVGGKTKLSPSTGEQLHNVSSSDRLTWPARGETSQNRDAGEHCELDSPSQNQAFNGIERIELATSRSDLRQVPTDRRRRSADAAPCVENASASEDPADGPPRGDGSDLLLDHRRADGICSGVSEIALGQLATQPQNILFSRDARSIDGFWCARWPVTPVDPIEPLFGGAFDPSPHGLKAYTKLAGNTAQRVATPNRLHHRTTLLLDGVLCSRVVSLFPSAYQPNNHLPGHQAMEAARLWKARPKAAAFPQPLENAPIHRPRFPQLSQPLLATRKRSVRSNQNNFNSTDQVTLGCWHLSDLGLLALRP